MLPETALPAAWRRPLAGLAITWIALILAFIGDWAKMVGHWWNSSTYSHVLLIPPIIAWLVWQRWPELRKLEPSGWSPGLALFAVSLLLWVLAAFAGLDLGRQLGAVAMLMSTALALLGPRVGRALAFPLFYMLFLVPFGDELVPPLQLITAKLTIALIHLTGVPAVIDGVFISTPAGLFEVAEACSGVKFLIAMIAFGVLACHICFTSWKRRAGFMALCIAAPILANGVRAWGTIYVAQIKGAAFATGFDHIIYGWLFFAAVIIMVLAISWRFFDRDPHAPLVDLAAIAASPLLTRIAARKIGLPSALGLITALVIAASAWAFAADRLSAVLPRQVFLPAVPQWQRVNYIPSAWWEPRAAGADHRLLGRYADARGHRVDVFIALYSGQSDGREAGGFGEGALTPESGWAWIAPGPDVAGGKADRLRGKGGAERLTETYYRTGSLTTGSNARLKLANISDRLLLRARPTMLLILSAEKQGAENPEAVIAAFRQSTGSLDDWMDRVARVR